MCILWLFSERLRILVVANNDVLFASTTAEAADELNKNTNKWRDGNYDSYNHDDVDSSWNAECVNQVIPVVVISWDVLKHVAACHGAAVVVNVQESSVAAFVHDANLVDRLFHLVLGVLQTTIDLVQQAFAAQAAGKAQHKSCCY